MAGPVADGRGATLGAMLLPIDSEHNAIFQCLPAGSVPGLPPAGLKRVLLTASGGPFRDLPRAALETVTPEAACAHPNWSWAARSRWTAPPHEQGAGADRGAACCLG